MNLGFYYHIPAVVNKSGSIGVPAFFGRFVDSLAVHVTHLYCFFHSLTESTANVEYWCKEKNITLISLGPDRPAYIKAFFPWLFFNKKVRSVISGCDSILVRGPSPLAPYFQTFNNQCNIIHFLVGSYGEGSKHLKLPFYKEWAVKLLVRYMHHNTIQSIQGAYLLVNSKKLEKEYGIYAKSVKQVFTTTLTNEDYCFKEDTCKEDTIRLLYTGRLDWAKGLSDLFDAFASLQHENGNFELHIVGWEDSKHKPVEIALKQRAIEQGFSQCVYFHGRKAVGVELFYHYRACDIYILPSYHEGFPRTIWEAMANCIPVICTPVGSIPEFLEDEKEAIFVPSHNCKEIVNKVNYLIKNVDIRKRLIVNGYRMASEIRLELQGKRIIEFIYEQVD